ncbi:MAG: carbohydrate ABC transporter permease, partial [Humibacillus sp.]
MAEKQPAARLRNRNWVGGTLSWVWLFVVLLPIYWIIITSIKSQSEYFVTNPFAPPTAPTMSAYTLVIESDFARYFLNSVMLTVGAVIPAVLISFMAAFAIIRSRPNWFVKLSNSIFL